MAEGAIQGGCPGDTDIVGRSECFLNAGEAAMGTYPPPDTAIYMFSRKYGLSPIFPEFKTPQTVDVLVSGWVFALCTLLVSFFVLLPGYRGKQMVFTAVRIIFSLFVGFSIIFSVFGQEWETARVEARVPYKAASSQELEHARLGVHIGLASVNITLRAGDEKNFIVEFEDANGTAVARERIDYNERFYFGFGQGRAFFGTQANELNQEFRRGQEQGLPVPILLVAEYFTFDGEGLRWGRNYRKAGWYSYIMVWLAFPLWIVTNILFGMVLSYGAVSLCVTGSSLITAIIIYRSIRNSIPLKIPFENVDGEEVVLEPQPGWTFGLCLATGVACVVAGGAVWVLNRRWPNLAADFFGRDVANEWEEYYESGEGEREEADAQATQDEGSNSEDVEMREVGMGENGPSAVEKKASDPPGDQEPVGTSAEDQNNEASAGDWETRQRASSRRSTVVRFRRRDTHSDVKKTAKKDQQKLKRASTSSEQAVVEPGMKEVAGAATAKENEQAVDNSETDKPIENTDDMV